MNVIERKRVVNSCSASDERATVPPLARVSVCVCASLLCSFNQQRINIIESENGLVSISRPAINVDSYFILCNLTHFTHVLTLDERRSCKTGNVYLLSIQRGIITIYFIFNDCGFSAA